MHLIDYLSRVAQARRAGAPRPVRRRRNPTPDPPARACARPRPVRRRRNTRALRARAESRKRWRGGEGGPRPFGRGGSRASAGVPEGVRRGGETRGETYIAIRSARRLCAGSALALWAPGERVSRRPSGAVVAVPRAPRGEVDNYERFLHFGEMTRPGFAGSLRWHLLATLFDFDSFSVHAHACESAFCTLHTCAR